MPCHLVHGTDEFRIANRVEQLLAKADLVSEMNLQRFDLNLSPDVFAEAVECALTPPFMGGHRVVVVESIGNIVKKPKGSDDEEQEPPADPRVLDVLQQLDKLPKYSMIILVDRTRKIDGRGKFFKTLEVFCEIDEINTHFFDPVEGNNWQLEKWLSERASEHGIRMTSHGMVELAMRLGSDLRAADMEMQKFRLAYGEGALIGQDEVAALTAPAVTHSVFSLCDALGQGRLDEAMNYLRGMLAAKSPAPYILTMLSRHARNLAIARQMFDSGAREGEVQEALKMKSAWVYKRFKPQADKFRGDYARTHAILTECDTQLKTSGLDPNTAIELCVLRLAAMMGG